MMSVMALAWSFVTPAVAGACPNTQDPASPVRLTDVVSSGGDALRQAAGEGDIGMLMDAQSLSVTDAHTAVFAVQDVQAAGRNVIAIVESDIEDGSAVVAAACQGMVIVGSASLTGCSDSWCGSPTRRDALAAQLAQVGGRDRAIADRLLGGTSALSYSPTQGAQPSVPPSGSGSILLAQQGKPMKLDAAALQAIGWAGQPQADVASAMAAIAAGQAKVQPKVPPRSAGKGSAPPPPGGQASPPSPPAGKAATPPPPNGALPPAAAAGLASVQKDLTTLKAALVKLDCYFTGGCGVWTENSKSLRDVWKNKDMTKDQTTVRSCIDLQAESVALADRMLSSIESVKRAAKGSAFAQREKLAALEKNLKSIIGDIKQNRSRGFEASSKRVIETDIK